MNYPQQYAAESSEYSFVTFTNYSADYLSYYYSSNWRM